MGYYTRYSLETMGSQISVGELAALIAGDPHASEAIEPNGDSLQAQKWYEHEYSLMAWSAKYPRTVFLLHAEGEDSDGIWDKYFLDGKLIRIESFKDLRRINLPELLAKLTKSA